MTSENYKQRRGDLLVIIISSLVYIAKEWNEATGTTETRAATYQADGFTEFVLKSQFILHLQYNTTQYYCTS